MTTAIVRPVRRGGLALAGSLQAAAQLVSMAGRSR